MISIVICVGSSCYVRGSDEVAGIFEALIDEEGLHDQVELVGAFCMEGCSLGVSVRIGDRIYLGVRPADAETLFYEQVLPQVQAAPAGQQHTENGEYPLQESM